MKLNQMLLAGAVCVLSACAHIQPAFDIRSPDRPGYTKTLTASELTSFLAQGGLLVDVRLSEDFEQDPALIPGAIRVDPENIAFWQSADRNVPVAVYCVKGKWVSQKQATYLAGLGFDAYSLEGGLAAFREQSNAED